MAALIVIVILTFAAAGVLSYSLTTYENSVRQTLLDKAKETADSEMEYLFYCWKTDLLNKDPVANISCVNPTTLAPNPSSPLVTASPYAICGTDMTTTEQAFSSSESGWNISRTLVYNPIAGTSDGSAQGIEPGTQQIGRNYYFSAKVSASINNPVLGTVSYHSGRHFVFSSTSLFQFAVFYQGNLEIAAGGNMTITGPISTNASAYMGSQSGYTLTISDTAYYFQDYNGASDPLTGETDRLQGTGALTDPVYNPNPQSSAPADQTAQRGLQVVKLSSQSSFIGGVDVANDIATYPSAYSNLSGVPDPNEVYRAVIAPPPADSSGTLYPEDPVVAASRMYNNASLLITVKQTSAGVPTVGTNVSIDIGTAANPTAYDTTFPALATGSASSIINPSGSTVRQQITDPREELNGTTAVNLTTIDIGNLNNALTSPTGALATNSELAAAYNGVLYVYDATNNTTVGQPNTLNAIRLVDGTTTPNVSDQNGNPIGFTVVSNNGVYVQGDYNTTQITAGGTVINNPTAIMGDAVTALSQGWTPAESGHSINNGSSDSRAATPSLPTAANGPMNPASAGTDGGGNGYGMTVNAAILTGNTPSTTTYNSGGVQNLVRMIEDWYDPDPSGLGIGMTLTLNGSLGQLFTSKYFTGPYKGNAIQSTLPGTNNRIYLQPKTRNFDYDAGFKSRSPAGSPTTTNFARGDFFFW